MSDRLRGHEALILACCVWAIHALLEMFTSGTFLAMALVWAAHGLILMLLMAFLLQRALQWPSRSLRIAACIVLPLTFALLQTVIDMVTTLWIGDALLQEVNPPPGMEMNSNNLEFQLGLKLNFKYYIWLFGFYGVTLALLQAVRQAYQARLDAQRAELDALRLQVNPHFLFNALNSVSSLILQQRHQDAEAMTMSMARFYRNNLGAEGVHTARLADELDAIDAYVDLERVRLGDALHLEVDCPDALLDTRLPPLLLQPLVENAIKHGGVGGGATSPVRLTIRAAGDRLAIVVENDLPPVPATTEGTSTGLANVRRRLRATFGDAAEMHAGAAGAVWRVRLSLPTG